MESLEITGFNMVDEVTIPEKLPSSTLTVLENMRLDDKIGAASTRKGFSLYESIPLSHILSYTGKSFSVSAEPTPYAVLGFTLDVSGIRMYTIAEDKKVYQYVLSTAFDPDTASYTGKSFDTSSETDNPLDIAISADGTSIFIMSNNNVTVFQYTLSSAFDVSTASYASKSFVISEDTSPVFFTFNPTGTSMFVVGYTNKTIYQYTLSTANDISTTSYASKSFLISEDTVPQDIAFNSTGTSMFVVGITNKKIYQYTLSSGFNVDTTSYANISFDISAEDSYPISIFLSSDNTTMIILGQANQKVFQYILSTVSGTVNNLFDIEDINGVNSLLANHGTVLSKLTSSAWSDLKTGLTASKMRMAAFGDKFFFTNGNEKPFYTDLTNIYDIGIDRPDISSVTLTNNDSIGASTQNVVIYIIAYLTTDGQMSSGSDKIAFTYDYNTEPYDITLDNIPVSSDSRVSQKMIFRNFGTATTKDFATFYLVATIANSVTSYTDRSSDSDLDSTTTIQYTNVPDKAKYICTNNDNIFLAAISKTLSNRVINPPYPSSQTIAFIDDSSSGDLEIGTYYYAYSLVDTAGNESDLIPFMNHTTTIDSKAITFSPLFGFAALKGYAPWVSQPIYDGSISYVRMYRSKKDESTIFYLLLELSPIVFLATNIVDGANDSTLSVTYPKSTHTNTEVSILPSSIIYSNLDKPLEYPERNYIEIYPDDSEVITGIFDDDNGIVVFKENNICKLYTVNDSSNWEVKKLVENIGCDQPDSIYKYGSIYFFVFRNQVYEWAGSGEPKEISYKRKPTFDLITEFLGATFYHSVLWYVLTVKIGSSYYLMCYDIKLETWYKFSIYKADCIIEKKFSSDKGKLLMGGNDAIIYYNESQIYDSDSGSNLDIYVQLKTKDYVFKDNFITARLMYMYINYYRLKNTTLQMVNFRLTDPVTGLLSDLADYDETYNQIIYKIPVDGMEGHLQRCIKLNLTITGTAIKSFYAAKIEYNVETWRNLHKTIIHKASDDVGMFMADDTGSIARDDTGGVTTY